MKIIDMRLRPPLKSWVTTAQFTEGTAYYPTRVRLSASEVRQNPGHAGSTGRDGRGAHYLGRDHGTAIGAAARGRAQ